MSPLLDSFTGRRNAFELPVVPVRVLFRHGAD